MKAPEPSHPHTSFRPKRGHAARVYLLGRPPHKRHRKSGKVDQKSSLVSQYLCWPLTTRIRDLHQAVPGGSDIFVVGCQEEPCRVLRVGAGHERGVHPKLLWRMINVCRAPPHHCQASAVMRHVIKQPCGLGDSGRSYSEHPPLQSLH